jgi:hypothetical protein
LAFLLTGRPLDHLQSALTNFVSAAWKAGVTRGRKSGFTFQDARRTAITQMLGNNIPIQARTGQTHERVLQ